MNELRSVDHLSNISIHYDWETPIILFLDACFRYKVNPILDVCATLKNAKCGALFTKEINGLLKQWVIDSFMNPPYSKINSWIAKAYKEHKENNITVLALTFAKTDTEWWHKYVEGKAEVHFIKGRIKFIDPNTRLPSKNSAPYPSCWIIWRKK